MYWATDEVGGVLPLGGMHWRRLKLVCEISGHLRQRWKIREWKQTSCFAAKQRPHQSSGVL